MFIVETTDRIIHPQDTSKPEPEQRYIDVRGRMNFGQRATFMNEVAAVQRVYGTCSDEHFTLLLMTHNIKAWGGPGFDGVKLTPKLIADLDPHDQLVVLAASTLAVNNQPRWRAPAGDTEQAADDQAEQEVLHEQPI